jgi:hypothetical protein
MNLDKDDEHFVHKILMDINNIHMPWETKERIIYKIDMLLF